MSCIAVSPRQDFRRILSTSGSRARIRPKIYFSGANPFANPDRLCERETATERPAMKRTLIRYKTRPEAADANAALVEAVFAELQARQPAGVRYLTLRLDDGVFVHVVEHEADDGPSPLLQLDAFQAFQRGIRERCVEPPEARGAMVVGNYRMLDEPG
jgi:hypothetical protein